MEKLILFFDTETTGLIQYGNRDLTVQPHIVQLGYILGMYDMRTHAFNIIERRSIFANPGVPIPEACTKVHGITDEMAAKFPQFKDQVGDFYRDAIDADLIVGHNVSFDFELIKFETCRMWSDEGKREAWLNKFKKKTLCTMHATTKLCEIPFPSGKKWNKQPKLQELHKFLFGQEFEKAHDAFADINATMECFLELRKRNALLVI